MLTLKYQTQHKIEYIEEPILMSTVESFSPSIDLQYRYDLFQNVIVTAHYYPTSKHLREGLSFLFGNNRTGQFNEDINYLAEFPISDIALYYLLYNHQSIATAIRQGLISEDFFWNMEKYLHEKNIPVSLSMILTEDIVDIMKMLKVNDINISTLLDVAFNFKNPNNRDIALYKRADNEYELQSIRFIYSLRNVRHSISNLWVYDNLFTLSQVGDIFKHFAQHWSPALWENPQGLTHCHYPIEFIMQHLGSNTDNLLALKDSGVPIEAIMNELLDNSSEAIYERQEIIGNIADNLQNNYENYEKIISEQLGQLRWVEGIADRQSDWFKNLVAKHSAKADEISLEKDSDLGLVNLFDESAHAATSPSSDINTPVDEISSGEESDLGLVNLFDESAHAATSPSSDINTPVDEISLEKESDLGLVNLFDEEESNLKRLSLEGLNLEEPHTSRRPAHRPSDLSLSQPNIKFQNISPFINPEQGTAGNLFYPRYRYEDSKNHADMRSDITDGPNKKVAIDSELERRSSISSSNSDIKFSLERRASISSSNSDLDSELERRSSSSSSNSDVKFSLERRSSMSSSNSDLDSELERRSSSSGSNSDVKFSLERRSSMSSSNSDIDYIDDGYHFSDSESYSVPSTPSSDGTTFLTRTYSAPMLESQTSSSVNHNISTDGINSTLRRSQSEPSLDFAQEPKIHCLN